MTPKGEPSSHNLKAYELALGFGMGRENIDGVFPCDGGKGLAQACLVQKSVECYHGYGVDELSIGCLCTWKLEIDCLMCGVAGQMNPCLRLLLHC